jgi:hypothetical protein
MIYVKNIKFKTSITDLNNTLNRKYYLSQNYLTLSNISRNKTVQAIYQLITALRV